MEIINELPLWCRFYIGIMTPTAIWVIIWVIIGLQRGKITHRNGDFIDWFLTITLLIIAVVVGIAQLFLIWSHIAIRFEQYSEYSRFDSDWRSKPLTKQRRIHRYTEKKIRFGNDFYF